MFPMLSPGKYNFIPVSVSYLAEEYDSNVGHGARPSTVPDAFQILFRGLYHQIPYEDGLH
jgi:hypothetical protein